jgi:hypothetical protein
VIGFVIEAPLTQDQVGPAVGALLYHRRKISLFLKTTTRKETVRPTKERRTKGEKRRKEEKKSTNLFGEFLVLFSRSDLKLAKEETARRKGRGEET